LFTFYEKKIKLFLESANNINRTDKNQRESKGKQMIAINQAKTTQWFTCKCLNDFRQSYGAVFTKGQTGFATVTDEGSVIVWTGHRKGCYSIIDSVDEAKKSFTCLKKCENKATAAKDAFNNAMF
jgi:hypothetical protein